MHIDSRRILFTIVLMLLLLAPAAAQDGCQPFKLPPGPEWGDFVTNLWYTAGEVTIGGESLPVFVTISPGDLYGTLGKKGNTAQGTEEALYDFGEYGSFKTNIRFVVQHNNDPGKFSMTATETIVPGSGTLRFANSTGHFADQGLFWITDWELLTGEGIFVTHGTICGVQ